MAIPESRFSDINDDAASKLHNDSLVIDGLIPTLSYLNDDEYLDHLLEGGITAANFTVAFNDDFLGTTKTIQQVWRTVENHPRLRLVRRVDDILQAKEENSVGVILGFQDSQPIEMNLEFVRAFAQMGVRIIQLTYNSQNYVGSGCWEENDTGLSYFGKDLIDELNRYGVLIDLSHCGDVTTMKAIEYSDDPVAFTHVASRELGHAHGRGKTDEQIRAVADNDGIIGITCHPPFLKKDPETHHVQEASIDDVLDHIDHVCGLVGPEHVSLGTDLMDKAYDTGVSPAEDLFDDRYRARREQHPEIFGSNDPSEVDPPAGFDRHTKFPNITRGLLSRGYSPEEVSGILGQNFYRVCERAWNNS